MALDDRLSDLLVDWEQSQRDGRETTPEELCKDAPDLLPVVRESIDSLKATRWMFAPDPSEPNDARGYDASRAALHDTELPASHLTVEQFAASIFQSGLLSATEIAELNQRLAASDLPGEAREIASRLVTEGKLTRYQASVLLKASKDPLLVDNYVILDTLDTGGMGLVFKALHRSMNRVVALKLLPAAMMSARDTVKRFQREVQAAASLSHPNIVAAFDADESAEIAYLVLEYVEGTNLFRLVKEQGPLSVVQACNYVRQAATGLAYLHSRGIIHRDVKPANLILANDGTVKLLDMGLVRFASSEDLSSVEIDQELTQAGIVIGTVAYMSPEQALDTRSADQRSDIYSLGCTLFFLLTSRSLYHEETGMKTLLAHREQAVPSIREFCEEAPVSLDAVFRTMVAKRPADRLQSMNEIIAALDACVPGLATNSPAAIAPRHAPSPRPISASGGRGWKRLRSSPMRIALAIAVVAALAAGGVYFAGTLIRIKSSKGTMDIYVDDPKATVEVTPGVAGQDGAAQSDNRHTAPSSADPFEKPREIDEPQKKIQELEVENQRLRSQATGVFGRGRRGRSGFPTAQIPEAGPQAFVVPRPQAAVSSVDRQVAQWLCNTPFTLICLHENPTRVISRIEEFPAGNAAIEAIFVGQGTRPPFSYQEADVERLASLRQLKWLSLKSSNVTDAFVVRLKSLRALEGLSLAGASITDECLPALVEMTQLSSLDLSGCGGITDAGLKDLASLKSLNDLTLAASGEDLKKSWVGLGRDFGWRRLPRLVLDYTQTTEAGLLKLQQALPNCSISASHILPGLGVPLPPPPGSSDRAWGKWMLQHLSRCWVYADVDPETTIAGPKDLPPIDFHIERIRFVATNEPGPVLNAFLFRRLGELSHLRGLEIDQKVTGRDLRGLAAIKSLRSLGLGEGSAGDDSLRPLASLTGLTALTMQGSEITDEGLKSLAPLKGLAQLALDGRARNLHGTGFDALVGNTALRSLNLTGAGIDDDGARQIARLTGLESLNLADTWIGGTGLAELSKLKHLKSLNLRFCRRLRSADLAPLVELPALEDLTLTDCRINDDAVNTLTKLAKLKTLKLGGTGLSAAAISDLHRKLPQTSITPSVQ
jgi:serine/threonine protein kinase